MTDEELKNVLPSIPTATLVQELTRRRQEWRDAEQALMEPAMQRAKYVTRGRPKGSTSVGGDTMKKAALDRWSKWAQYKKDHPNASTKDYFAWRRKQKA